MTCEPISAMVTAAWAILALVNILMAALLHTTYLKLRRERRDLAQQRREVAEYHAWLTEGQPPGAPPAG